MKISLFLLILFILSACSESKETITEPEIDKQLLVNCDSPQAQKILVLKGELDDDVANLNVLYKGNKANSNLNEFRIRPEYISVCGRSGENDPKIPGRNGYFYAEIKNQSGSQNVTVYHLMSSIYKDDCENLFSRWQRGHIESNYKLDVTCKFPNGKYTLDKPLTNTNGLPDISFGSGGYITHKINSNWVVTDSKIDQDNSIYVLAHNKKHTSKLHLLKFDKSGDIDQTFANNGIFEFNFPNIEKKELYSTALAIDKNNNLFLAGAVSEESRLSTPNFSFVIKLDSNGRIDSTFGKAGIFKHVSQEGSIVYHFSEIEFDRDDIFLSATHVKSDTGGAFQPVTLKINKFAEIDQEYIDSQYENRAEAISWGYGIEVIDGESYNVGSQGGLILMHKFKENGVPDGNFGGFGRNYVNMRGCLGNLGQLNLNKYTNNFYFSISCMFTNKLELIVTSKEGKVYPKFSNVADKLGFSNYSGGKNFKPVVDGPKGSLFIIGTARGKFSDTPYMKLAKIGVDGDTDKRFGINGVTRLIDKKKKENRELGHLIPLSSFKISGEDKIMGVFIRINRSGYNVRDGEIILSKFNIN